MIQGIALKKSIYQNLREKMKKERHLKVKIEDGREAPWKPSNICIYTTLLSTIYF